MKTALDMEIAVYKQLLETEEDRLGIKQGKGRHNYVHLNDLRGRGRSDPYTPYNRLPIDCEHDINRLHIDSGSILHPTSN